MRIARESTGHVRWFVRSFNTVITVETSSSPPRPSKGRISLFRCASWMIILTTQRIYHMSLTKRLHGTVIVTIIVPCGNLVDVCGLCCRWRRYSTCSSSPPPAKSVQVPFCRSASLIVKYIPSISCCPVLPHRFLSSAWRLMCSSSICFCVYSHWRDATRWHRNAGTCRPTGHVSGRPLPPWSGRVLFGCGYVLCAHRPELASGS